MRARVKKARQFVQNSAQVAMNFFVNGVVKNSFRLYWQEANLKREELSAEKVEDGVALKYFQHHTVENILLRQSSKYVLRCVLYFLQLVYFDNLS